MIASDEPKPKSVGFGTRFKNMIPSPFTSDSSRNVNQVGSKMVVYQREIWVNYSEINLARRMTSQRELLMLKR